MQDDRQVLWTPEQQTTATPPNLQRFITWLEKREGCRFADYDTLHRWSVDDVGRFWAAATEFLGVRFRSPADQVVRGSLPNAVWFPGACLNYAEHCLVTGLDADPAIVSHSESRERREITRGELRDEVARIRAGLIRLGVKRGDRVAAYLPNVPEAIAAMLATASIGAIWTSCSPDFGAEAVVARWKQVQPRVILAVDCYRHRGCDFKRAQVLAEIREQLPSVEQLVVLGGETTLPGAHTWAEVFADVVKAPLEFEPVPFDHPVAIMFSSGTTGAPKPIVHGHGGFVVEHLKWLVLHEDLLPSDRVFWFSSTGWLAWNLGISSLMCGSTLVTLDGDPMHPSLDHYWKLLAAEQVTYVGVSPGFLAACRDAGVVPRDIADLSRLRTMTAGGAPMSAALFKWVYDSVGTDLYLASSSGGTDVAGSIVGGNRMLPVRAGVIACRLLGVDATAFSEEGQELPTGEGELVIRQPMPSMPVEFWNDPTGERFRQAYFDRFPAIWCHGDWVSFNGDGTCVVTGRSDATLNRGGVRIGTSEIYSAIERQEEVLDSLVVHLEDPEGGVGRLLLFVELREGSELDSNLEGHLRETLRTTASPRHVPDRIYTIPTIPRTPTGKKLEVPVKRILQGSDPYRELAKSGVGDIDVVKWFSDWQMEELA